jgi:hypothetical protein
MTRAARWPNRGVRTRARPFSGIARGYPSTVSGYAFSDSQADLVTGDKLRAIVGDKSLTSCATASPSSLTARPDIGWSISVTTSSP